MRIEGRISALEEIAIELFGKLGCSGVLITVFYGENNVLIVSVDRYITSDEHLKTSPTLWLNKEVIEIEHMLVIDNSVTHPLCQRILPKHRFALGAFLGRPIITSNGQTIGSAGAYYSTAHRWSDREMDVIGQMAKDVLAVFNDGAGGFA